MGLMHIIWMIVVGFVVGLLARFFYPGAVNLGFWMTTALGIAGSVVGGLLSSMIWKTPDGRFHPGRLLHLADRRADPALGLPQFREMTGRRRAGRQRPRYTTR